MACVADFRELLELPQVKLEHFATLSKTCQQLVPALVPYIYSQANPLFEQLSHEEMDSLREAHACTFELCTLRMEELNDVRIDYNRATGVNASALTNLYLTRMVFSVVLACQSKWLDKACIEETACFQALRRCWPAECKEHVSEVGTLWSKLSAEQVDALVEALKASYIQLLFGDAETGRFLVHVETAVALRHVLSAKPLGNALVHHMFVLLRFFQMQRYMLRVRVSEIGALPTVTDERRARLLTNLAKWSRESKPSAFQNSEMSKLLQHLFVFPGEKLTFQYEDPWEGVHPGSITIRFRCDKDVEKLTEMSTQYSFPGLIGRPEIDARFKIPIGLYLFSMVVDALFDNEFLQKHVRHNPDPIYLTYLPTSIVSFNNVYTIAHNSRVLRVPQDLGTLLLAYMDLIQEKDAGMLDGRFRMADVQDTLDCHAEAVEEPDFQWAAPPPRSRKRIGEL